MGNLLEAENLLVGAENYQFILIDWGMSGVTEKVWIRENLPKSLLPKSFLYCQILKCFLYLQCIKKKKKGTQGRYPYAKFCKIMVFLEQGSLRRDLTVYSY